jgi:hypothetical protein
MPEINPMDNEQDINFWFLGSISGAKYSIFVRYHDFMFSISHMARQALKKNSQFSEH